MTTGNEEKGNHINKKPNNQSQTLETQQNRGDNERSRQTALARGEQGSHSPISGSPFTFMRRFSEQMDRLFDDFGFGRGWLVPRFGRDLTESGFDEFSAPVWSPQVEVFEREGQLVIRADLPGLTKDDVKVEVTNDEIIVSGERKSEHEEKGEGFYRTERSYGSFYRSIPLPEGVNPDEANASFKNGVLEITMQAPQRHTRGRRLEITEGGKPESRGQASGR